MRHLFAAMILVLGLAGPGWAQLPPGVSGADQAAIQGVITRQMDAFRRDDAVEAYGFAAPGVKEIFPSPEQFMGMVRQGYRPVYRPRSVEFSELAFRDGAIVQEVEVVGPDGQAALAVYTMVRDGQGGWLIAGCALLPSVRAGA